MRLLDFLFLGALLRIGQSNRKNSNYQPGLPEGSYGHGYEDGDGYRRMDCDSDDAYQDCCGCGREDCDMIFKPINIRSMKKAKYLYLVMTALMTLAVTTSCSKDDEDDETYHSLFVTCDYFIDMLDTVYERYDAFGQKARDTSDGKFTVAPMGRLMIVSKKTVDPSITYSGMEAALKSHYKNNGKVKDVFQNKGGTITIDCRK